MKKIKQNNKFQIILLTLIAILGFYSFLHLQSTPIRQVNAETGDIQVVGGTLGEDYTYDNGVLRFIKDGNYTLSMKPGVNETSDRIELDHNSTMQNIIFTLDNISINSTSSCFTVDPAHMPSSESEVNIEFKLKGKNTFKADSTTYNSMITSANLKISALNGNDSIEFIAKNNEGSINNQSFILESGKVITQKTNITTMHGPIQINGGELNVDSTESSGALYTNDSFVMNNGKVNINTTGSTCVFATGFLLEDKDGIKILGGDFNCNATGTGKGAITAGNSANRYSSRNVIIDTTGTVTINHKYIGIALLKDSKLTINNGTLKINGQAYGIYSAGNGKISVNGGETEVTAQARAATAIKNNGSDKAIHIDPNYTHKSYHGDTEEGREYMADDSTLMNPSDGATKKYILITPAYPINYELDGGNLVDDLVNPTSYSRVDSFKLNNPVKEGYDFIGWTGTDLNNATQEVSIAEGSKGERSYKANWHDPNAKDDEEPSKDENDYRVLPAKDDDNNTNNDIKSPNTYDSNPLFYIAIVGGSILILVAAFIQGKELIKR